MYTYLHPPSNWLVLTLHTCVSKKVSKSRMQQVKINLHKWIICYSKHFVIISSISYYSFKEVSEKSENMHLIISWAKKLFGWIKMNIKKTILTILLWYSLKTAYQNPILHDFAKIAIV